MIQEFIVPDKESLFPDGTCLQLLSISNVPSENLCRHPRAAHAHSDFVELYLAVKGSGECLLNLRPYALQGGDILVIDCNTVHDEVQNQNKGMDIITIQFTGIQLPNLQKNCMVEADKSPYIPAGPHSKLILHMMQNMYDAYMESLPGSATVCNYMLYALVGRILMLLRDQKTLKKKGANDWQKSADIVESYIDAHYAEPITLQSIGEALNLSPSYISHVFKKATNFSPIQYLTRRRLGEAETLLIYTNEHITEIAFSIGYETVSNFNNSFQKYIGISPSAYRKKYRNTEPPLRDPNAYL